MAKKTIGKKAARKKTTAKKASGKSANKSANKRTRKTSTKKIAKKTAKKTGTKAGKKSTKKAVRRKSGTNGKDVVVYAASKDGAAEQRHCIAVLVRNEAGVLARVVGLFSGRGYNIESLTVSEVHTGRKLSRINIVTRGTPRTLEQICAQLERLVPVLSVADLTLIGASVERETALLRVIGSGTHRLESLRIADMFRARVVDSGHEHLIFEVTGDSGKVDAFIRLMEPIGLTEISRTGIVALNRGAGI